MVDPSKMKGDMYEEVGVVEIDRVGYVSRELYDALALRKVARRVKNVMPFYF